MRIVDIFDIINDPFGALEGLLGGTLAVLLLCCALAVLAYIFKTRALNNIGEKAGLQRSWMVYVPIANTLYFLKVAGAPWWYVFLMGQGGGMINVILLLLGAGSRLLHVIWMLHLVSLVAFHALASIKYYDTLHLPRMLTASRVLPVISGIAGIVDLLMAYTPVLDTAIQGKIICADKPDPVTTSAGRIRGLSGMYAGAVFDVNNGQKIVFGRDSASCNVIFDAGDNDISRQHCTIEYQNGSYFVTDTSSNGTFQANGTRLPAQVRSALPKNSSIYLGSNKNTFRLE